MSILIISSGFWKDWNTYEVHIPSTTDNMVNVEW
jgi:hypothetical protein